MKPWKETWEAAVTKDGPLGIIRFPDGWNVDLTGGGRNIECEERAQLAAAAPEMARLLIELQKCGEGVTSSYLDREDVSRVWQVLRKAGLNDKDWRDEEDDDD